jgi:hypothetical protein
MHPAAKFTRPTLEEALATWKQLLAKHGFSTELLWIFEENLCFEKTPKAAARLRPGFQIKFTPPPDEALDTAFDHFCETDARIVFYRLGGNAQRSICLLLADPWFEAKGESDGYVRRDEWRVSFYPGRGEEIEEVTDMRRWVRRNKRARTLRPEDFCMTLAAIEEINTHGRVLAPYERFADHIVGKLRRIYAQAE